MSELEAIRRYLRVIIGIIGVHSIIMGVQDISDCWISPWYRQQLIDLRQPDILMSGMGRIIFGSVIMAYLTTVAKGGRR